jgi:cation transporter-like permease
MSLRRSVAQFRMMHVHLPAQFTALAVLNVAVAVSKLATHWCQGDRRKLQLGVLVAILAAAIFALVMAILMNVFGVSVIDQSGHEKLRKIFLCSVVLNCAMSEAYQVYFLAPMRKLVLIFGRMSIFGISARYPSVAVDGLCV